MPINLCWPPRSCAWRICYPLQPSWTGSASGLWSPGGGATFDACIRYLGEDPWVQLRELKAAMPNTPQQMLLRGQNLLGYRHYADDLVHRFVELAHGNGMDVFRIFDAMNDVAICSARSRPRWRWGPMPETLCYTTSPVHGLRDWVDMAKRLQDLGCHSLSSRTWPVCSGLMRLRR